MMMDLYNQEELINLSMKKKVEKARAEAKAEGRAEGKAEGIAEGIVKGRAEEKQNTLLNLAKEGVIKLALAANQLGLTEREVERML